jgi:hypothetical protein
MRPAGEDEALSPFRGHAQVERAELGDPEIAGIVVGAGVSSELPSP